MAIQHSILGIEEMNDLDVANMAAPDKTKWVLVDTTALANGGREALFQLTVGEADYPASIRIGHYPNRNANGGLGQTNVSIKFSTYVKTIDTSYDPDQVVRHLPCSATLAWTMPYTSGVPDLTDLSVMLQNLYAWVTPIEGGTFGTSTLSSIAFGIVNQKITDTQV